MFTVRSYTVCCRAKTLLENGWDEKDYWSLFDLSDSEEEERFEEDLFGIWNYGYSSTSFEGGYELASEDGGDEEPVVYATMFVLYDEDRQAIERESQGKLSADDILDWFPELETN